MQPTPSAAPPPTFPLAPGWDQVPTHAQRFPESAPAPGVNAAGSWPAYEFDLVQDALRAGAESIGRRGRRAAIALPAPLPPAREHVESAQYWGAAPAPSGASDRPPVNGFYLSPVTQAPSWEQVVPTATPWSVWPKLPSPTSWGETTSGIECRTSGGQATCTTPGGRQVPFPAPPGFPAYIGPGEGDYHYYSKPVGAAPVDPARLMQGVVERPTPGPRQLVRPATAQGTLNEATPIVGRRPPISPVKSYLTTDQNGTPVVVNVTEPGHRLDPGIVMRYVTTSPSGSTIQNEGAGLGALQGPGYWGFARDQINDVWTGQSKGIIERQSRPDVPRRKGQPLGR